MFRLDYNVTPKEGGFNVVQGAEENTLWRHVETMYAILDRVRTRFPTLQWENCAGGGGRTDIGMVSRATTTWVSDWMKMPRTVRILNGMSLALPPEYIDRLYGACMEAGYRGNAETQMHVAILAHPTFSGLTPSLAEANPHLLDLARKYIGIYKDFIRPFHRQARVYHHTPVIPGADGTGWAALEYVAADHRRAVAGVFRLMNAETETYRFRFRGLDPAEIYRVRTEPGSLVQTATGAALVNDGLEIRLDSAMTSRLLLVEVAD
jgi:alpha-galactosidase